MMIFDERYYLDNNLDVKNSFNNGGFKSGYHHYIIHGFKENRKVQWSNIEYDMKKPNFVIWTAPFSFSCGGHIALHKLASLIKEEGENAWIWLEVEDYNMQNYYNLPIANGVLNLSKQIAIYPSIIPDNPLNSKHVVRWILGPSIYNKTHSWDEKDVIASIAPGYSKIDYPNAIPLWVTESFKEEFNNKRTVQRNGTCFTVRKAADQNKKRIKEIEEFEIPRTYTMGYLSSIFRSKKIFYSYDTHTGLSLLAAMCGCISVVIPDEGVSKEEWHNGEPAVKYGVAYGIDDIDWAISTMHLVENHLEELQLKSRENVKDFIKIIKDKI